MADKVLDQFVKEALAAGKSRAEIAGALQSAGWDKDQINNALAAYADVEFPVAVPRPRQYGSAREAFLYIVYFALLGLVAVYVGQLAFGWIESVFEDELARQYLQSGAPGLRWAIAGLVVGYPVFLYLGARLSSVRRKNAERRASRIRVWLTYITLIFSTLTLIGDLVAVVYQFLSGELGVRFLAKAGVVAAISGAILWNYSRDAERTDARIDWPGRALAIIVTVITSILVIWAFTMVRSPAAARARLADEQRIDDISVIVRLLDCHQTYFGGTPQSLDALQENLAVRSAQSPVAPGCGASVPADPELRTPYRYNQIDSERYSICVTFKRGWPEDERRDDNDRRRLTGQLRYRGDDRYVALPVAPGEVCFDINAIDFEKKMNGDE